jgi:hypothetical protein
MKPGSCAQTTFQLPCLCATAPQIVAVLIGSRAQALAAGLVLAENSSTIEAFLPSANHQRKKRPNNHAISPKSSVASTFIFHRLHTGRYHRPVHQSFILLMHW